MMKRIFLLAGAIGWGISIAGVILPWRMMDQILQNLGAAGPVTDPLTRYWFRMAAGAWSVIGFFCLMAFLSPAKYRKMIPLLGIGSLFEGVVLLLHGMVLDLPLFPFAADVGFCLITGCGLLFTGTDMGKIRYPLLAGRIPDPSAWKLDDVDPGITAAYLETVSYAFDLDRPRDLFRLRPEDSLFDLYDSYYKTGRQTAFFLATDNMELEECSEAFEDLCRFSGTEFDCRKSLRDELRTIAANRKNLPLTADEIKSLRLTMRFLDFLDTHR